jgi:hypothetical protein
VPRLILHTVAVLLNLCYCPWRAMGSWLAKPRCHGVLRFIISSMAPLVSLFSLVMSMASSWVDSETKVRTAQMQPVSILITWTYAFHLMKGCCVTGRFVKMIESMIQGSAPFLVIMFTVGFAFYQSFFFVLSYQYNATQVSQSAIPLDMFNLMLGGDMVQKIEDAEESMHAPFIFLTCSFSTLVTVLLLNLLIAIMGNDCGKIEADSENH